MTAEPRIFGNSAVIALNDETVGLVECESSCHREEPAVYGYDPKYGVSIYVGFLELEPDYPPSNIRSDDLKSKTLSLSAIGSCAAIVVAMLVPSQAWAESQPAGPGSTADEVAARILDQQADLTVEDALQMSGKPSVESATIDATKAIGHEFEIHLTRAGARAMHVTCTGANKGGKALATPHYSKGAGRAIFKTNIKCTGYGASTVRLRGQGLLSFAPAKSSNDTANKTFKARATSDYWQTITVNGPSKTFYTPRTGKHGGVGKGFWINTSTWYFNANGVTSTVGSETKVHFLNIVKR